MNDKKAAFQNWWRYIQKDKRDQIIAGVIITTYILTMASLYLAHRSALAAKGTTLHSSGYWLIAGWVIGPPLYFLSEYTLLPPRDDDERERVHHYHDLCRNLWLAFVAILTVLVTGTFPGAGE